MEAAAALSGLTSLATSNATNGWFQGFPNDAQKTMLHVAIVSLVCLFCCFVSATRLQSVINYGGNYEAAARCFQGLITVFSTVTVAMLSACILPGYFKLFSCLFCSIPVIVHTISDTRWFRDWLPKPHPILPSYQQNGFRAMRWRCFIPRAIKWLPWTNKRGGIVSNTKPEQNQGDSAVSNPEP